MKYKLFVILIFSLAFILRFWQLGLNPPSLDWDEASLGYNAYSILLTGKDEYGIKLPISIRSFGDYKPALYTYLTIIPVALFGLNEFSVRFVSALLGSLSVVVGFFLIREIFPEKNRKFPLLFLLFFAVSPWHIQFSRIAFEANSALFFFLTGIWLFFLGLRKGYFFIPSFLSFALSLYAYHSPRLVVPLLIVGMSFLYRRNIIPRIKWFILSFILFMALLSPLIVQFKSTGGARLGSVTVLNPEERLGSSIRETGQDQSSNDIFGIILHNRRIVYAREILAGYLDHFNFDFLFLTGDPPGRHHAAGMGMLYFWDLPFILIGVYMCIKKIGKNIAFLFWWFILAPSASAVTTGTPHAVRSLLYIPLYQMFAAAGFIYLLSVIRDSDRKIIKSIPWILSFLLIVNFYYYLHMYWIHTPLEYSQWWQYGYKQAVSQVSAVESNYRKIIVTYKYDQPYIFFLFYEKTDPSWYQSTWGGGEILRANRSYGKYEFRNIDWSKDSQIQGILLVGTPDEIPKDAPGLISEIHFLDGSVAFRIVGR